MSRGGPYDPRMVRSLELVMNGRAKLCLSLLAIALLACGRPATAQVLAAPDSEPSELVFQQRGVVWAAGPEWELDTSAADRWYILGSWRNSAIRGTPSLTLSGPMV